MAAAARAKRRPALVNGPIPVSVNLMATALPPKMTVRNTVKATETSVIRVLLEAMGRGVGDCLASNRTQHEPQKNGNIFSRIMGTGSFAEFWISGKHRSSGNNPGS
jgi:hypothetical protein